VCGEVDHQFEPLARVPRCDCELVGVPSTNDASSGAVSSENPSHRLNQSGVEVVVVVVEEEEVVAFALVDDDAVVVVVSCEYRLSPSFSLRDAKYRSAAERLVSSLVDREGVTLCKSPIMEWNDEELESAIDCLLLVESSNRDNVDALKKLEELVDDEASAHND